jgi:hypothetical protein
MRRILWGLGALVLAGCCTPPAPRVEVRTIDTACQWARPIAASPRDTKETKIQAIALADAWTQRCGGLPK